MNNSSSDFVTNFSDEVTPAIIIYLIRQNLFAESTEIKLQSVQLTARGTIMARWGGGHMLYVKQKCLISSSVNNILPLSDELFVLYLHRNFLFFFSTQSMKVNKLISIPNWTPKSLAILLLVGCLEVVSE